jgi:hypothetical protein
MSPGLRGCWWVSAPCPETELPVIQLDQEL